MKRIIILTVATLLLLSVAACFLTGYGKAHVSDYDRKMYDGIYTKLSDTLTNFEVMYSAAEKAYSYAEKFSGEPTWENLQRARIASTAALNVISELSVCELDITREEMEFCAAKDIAIDSLYSFNLDDFTVTQSDFIKIMKNSNISLFSGVFYDENYKLFNTELSLHSEALYIYRDVAYLYANAVMCNFPKELEKTYLAELKQTHPFIFSTECPWGDTEADVVILLNEETAALEENTFSMTYLVGGAEGELEKAKLNGFVYNNIELPYEKVQLPSWVNFTTDSVVYTIKAEPDVTDIDYLVENANYLTIRSSKPYTKTVRYAGTTLSPDYSYHRPYLINNGQGSLTLIQAVDILFEGDEIVFKMDVSNLCLAPNM